MQEQLCEASPRELSTLLSTVRFRCTLRIYRFLREGLQRYPLSQMRISKPLPGDRWRQPAITPLVLQPFEGETHSFPIEINLPPWTVSQDVDFRRWLFGYGEAVEIDTPEELRLERRLMAEQLMKH